VHTQVRLKFGHGFMIVFTELSLLKLEKKIWKYQFPLSNFCRDVCVKLKLNFYSYPLELGKFEIWRTFDTYSLWRLLLQYDLSKRSETMCNASLH
jgi:hypothetical protein